MTTMVCSKSQKVSPAYEAVMELIDGSVELDGFEPVDGADRLYKTGNMLFPYVYWDKLFYTDVNLFCLPDLGVNPKDLGINIQGGFDFPKGEYKKQLETMAARINDAAARGDWVYVFCMIDKRIAIGMYIHCFSVIPDKLKWDAFVEMYQRVELGFEMLEPMYHEIFKYAKLSKARNKRIRKLAKDAGKRFTIYHGAKLEGSRWDPKDYYSWTLSEEVAEFFALRFNDKGEIWKREIDHRDAVDYLVDRNEEEVLIDYEELLDGSEIRYPAKRRKK